MEVWNIKLPYVQGSFDWPFDIGLPFRKVKAIETLNHKCNELGPDEAKSIVMTINNAPISVLAELFNLRNETDKLGIIA